MQGPRFESSSDNADNNAVKGDHTSVNLLDLTMVAKSGGSTNQSAPLKLRDAVAAGATATSGTADAPKACKSSPAYEERIDFVARNIFDPSTLGNLQQLKSKYNCDIERTKDPLRYVKTALDVDDTDPYTTYMRPSAYQNMQKSQQGKEVGAGVSFTMPTAADDKSGVVPPLVVQSYDATDARGRELKAGDQVLSINGVSMQGKTWRDGLQALGGEENSLVKLHILRDGVEKDVVVKRTSEDVPNVTTDVVDGQFAHIQVKSFMNENTSAEIEKAILANPKAEGYILDLRNNGGGLLDQGITAASVFISEGKVLNIKTRLPSDPSAPRYENDVYAVGKDAITKSANGAEPVVYTKKHADSVHKPVVVLVDQGTASAAEILAGALKDTDGAYLIGTPTYGKGIGQTIFPDTLTGGATKITTFRYYTPSGFWPGDGHDTRIGLQPNLVVKNPAPALFNTKQDGQINAAAAYLRTRMLANKH